MDLIRIAVLVLLAGILVSLGQGLFHLSSGRDTTGRMARALTVRIALSVALFLVLMVSWYTGVLHPHAGP